MSIDSRTSLHFCIAPGVPTYEKLPLEQRLQLARHMFPKFNPTIITNAPALPEQYNKEWWKVLTGDEQNNVFWSALFPERISKDWTNKPSFKTITFYVNVDINNAIDWYYSCPPHLRRTIDQAVEAAPAPDKLTKKDAAYARVKELWGDRPTPRHEDDIHLTAWQEEWDAEYRRHVLINATLTHASRIQEERRMLNEAMGLNVDATDLPNQADGLDSTLSATVRWLQSSGEMPLEFLARTYRSDDIKMSDRLTAARTLMDYVHRKVPAKTEIETKDLSAPKLDPAILKGLSQKELETLEKLLAKLNPDG